MVMNGTVGCHYLRLSGRHYCPVLERSWDLSLGPPKATVLIEFFIVLLSPSRPVVFNLAYAYPRGVGEDILEVGKNILRGM
jgi:hypothetical protein